MIELGGNLKGLKSGNSKSLFQILEKELKDFEKSSTSYFNNEDYLSCKTKLDKIYDKKNDGLRIRSKCELNEKREKSTKLILNLEKKHAIQNFGC